MSWPKPAPALPDSYSNCRFWFGYSEHSWFLPWVLESHLVGRCPASFHSQKCASLDIKLNGHPCIPSCSSRSTSFPGLKTLPRDPSAWSVTICGEASALLGGHAWFIRRIHITVDIGAARATDGEGLPSQHSSQGSVHLGGHLQVRLWKHQSSPCHRDRQGISVFCNKAPLSPTPIGGDDTLLSEAASWEAIARRI